MPDAPKIRTVVLVSGGGSNLESILAAKASGALPQNEIVLVISSNPDAFALLRAKNYAIPTAVLKLRDFSSDEAFQAALLNALVEAKADLICLAGYMRKIGPLIVSRFRGRILNIHPSLLPKYGGAGLYGHKVHEAVVAAQEKESGCTVHLVDEEFDHGRTLAQTRVPVRPLDTAEKLAARVLKEEHVLYPKVIRDFSQTLGRQS